jgi:hypothetical protein
VQEAERVMQMPEYFYTFVRTPEHNKKSKQISDVTLDARFDDDTVASRLSPRRESNLKFSVLNFFLGTGREAPGQIPFYRASEFQCVGHYISTSRLGCDLFSLPLSCLNVFFLAAEGVSAPDDPLQNSRSFPGTGLLPNPLPVSLFFPNPAFRPRRAGKQTT